MPEARQHILPARCTSGGGKHMAEHTPSRSPAPPTSGLASTIEKGASVHDAAGVAVGNVTDVDLTQERLVVDGRPVGFDEFSVPLSSVSAVHENDVTLNMAVDVNSPGTTRWLDPPAPITPAATRTSANTAPAATGRSTPPSPLDAPTAAGSHPASTTHAPFSTPIGGATNAPPTFRAAPAGSQATPASGRMSAGPTPTWAHDVPSYEEGDGMMRPIMMGLGGLAVTGLATAGFAWWRRRRRKSTFERMMDLATDIMSDMAGQY